MVAARGSVAVFPHLRNLSSPVERIAFLKPIEAGIVSIAG